MLAAIEWPQARRRSAGCMEAMPHLFVKDRIADGSKLRASGLLILWRMNPPLLFQPDWIVRKDPVYENSCKDSLSAVAGTNLRHFFPGRH
jgi:hypothetical protein